jgi:hypothetical protein
VPQHDDFEVLGPAGTDSETSEHGNETVQNTRHGGPGWSDVCPGQPPRPSFRPPQGNRVPFEKSNFKAFDAFDDSTSTATSVKSVDLTSSSNNGIFYGDASALKSKFVTTLNYPTSGGFFDKINKFDFDSTPSNGVPFDLDNSDILNRELFVEFEAGLDDLFTPDVWDTLDELKALGLKQVGSNGQPQPIQVRFFFTGY